MAAESEPHCRKDLVSEAIVFPAPVAREQRSGKDVCGDRFLHRRVNGPLAFPAVGNPPTELLEFVVTGEFERTKVEQPG